MKTTKVFEATLGSQLSLPPGTKLFRETKLSRFPLITSFPRKPSKQVNFKATPNPICDGRKFEIQLPSPWTQQFHSVSIDVSEMDAIREEISVLKPKVKNTLMSSHGVDSTKKRILMIYVLVSLGLAFHFEEEIHETLNESFEKIEELMDGEEDLCKVSTIFLVFRRYGHHISSDVFKRFKREDGNFKESLIDDAKGMLSLYEASHLGTPKEYILDEALSFTSSHLESLAACGTCPSHLSIRIRSALELCQHWNMEMLVPVEYIPFYGQEKDHDKMLLKFSKLSFKLVQLQYIQEVKVITKWYRELKLESKLPPYLKDRTVVNHFYVQSMIYEPHLSRGRIMMTQYFNALLIIDDTFDRYASLSEATSLANSLKRWFPDHTMEEQPDYLKFVLSYVLDIFEEFEKELGPQGKSYNVSAAKEQFQRHGKANFDFAKWALGAHMPSFEEYMEVGGVEVAVYATMSSRYMSMERIVAKEAFEWLMSKPKFVQALCTKSRLMNDITGYEDDMSRGYVMNGINCYMKQYGVTEKEAFTELNKMVGEADKIMNDEFLTTTGVSCCVLKAVMELGRMITVSYNGYEGFTIPEGKIKEYMTSLYIDQIHL